MVHDGFRSNTVRNKVFSRSFYVFLWVIRKWVQNVIKGRCQTLKSREIVKARSNSFVFAHLCSDLPVNLVRHRIKRTTQTRRKETGKKSPGSNAGNRSIFFFFSFGCLMVFSDSKSLQTNSNVIFMCELVYIGNKKIGSGSCK